MNDSDNENNGKLPNEGNNDKPTRDARGRWLPGYCPNPKGAPRKKTLLEQLRDYSDIKMFGDEIVDVIHDGKKTYMSRRSALNCKIFESAMKDSVYAQRILYKEFEKSDKRMAHIRVRYEAQIFRWLDAVRKSKGEDEIDFPREQEIELIQIEDILSHYSGGQFPTMATDQRKIRLENKKARRPRFRDPDDILG